MICLFLLSGLSVFTAGFSSWLQQGKCSHWLLTARFPLETQISLLASVDTQGWEVGSLLLGIGWEFDKCKLPSSLQWYFIVGKGKSDSLLLPTRFPLTPHRGSGLTTSRSWWILWLMTRPPRRSNRRTFLYSFH